MLKVSGVCGSWFHPLRSMNDGFGKTLPSADSEDGGEEERKRARG